MSQHNEHRHLIHRDQLDQINEHLSQRAAADAGRTVGLSIIGYVFVVVGIALGVLIKDPNPKFIFSIMGFGVFLTWLGKNGNVHLNNPTDFT